MIAADLPAASPRTRTGTTTRLPTCNSPSPHRVFVITSRCRNINLLAIDYAFRPRLRIRLTLGGIAFPRKPWAFGEQASHLFSRYLYRHSHFRFVQSSSSVDLHPDAERSSTNAARQRLTAVRGFGAQLSPVNFRRRPARPVSCYALFK